MKDFLLPKEMAANAESIGVNKVNAPFSKTFILAILAGAFIAFGAAFYTAVTANSNISEGITKLIGGITFSLGLILVIVGGAELFTGNNLIVMAWANGKVSLSKMLINWLWVYIGNALGALVIAILMLIAKSHHAASGAVGLHLLNIAKRKCELDFFQAIASGVLCNILVCLAVWLCFSSKSISGKILAIIFPISAFVALGFEHSIANIYFILKALLIFSFDTNYIQIFLGQSLSNFESISWYNFIFHNLIPVTIGNVLGGGVLVGAVYWFVYLRSEKTKTIE
jgi:formate transporter